MTLERCFGFFRKLRMSPKQPFKFHLNWIFHVHVRIFDPNGVFVDFWKGPIMSEFISFHEFFLNLRDEDELYGIGLSLKWALDEEFLIKYEKVMPGQSLVDFSYRNPNLATFDFWWIRSVSWGIMINPWSNDGYHFKVLMLTKNLDVWLYVGHSWLLT